jgi:hypothetical protein
MTRQARSSLSGQESLADGLVYFTLCVYYWSVALMYPFVILIGVFHVIEALICMQKINFYLFRCFALVEPPHPLCLGALRGKRLAKDHKVEWGFVRGWIGLA